MLTLKRLSRRGQRQTPQKRRPNARGYQESVVRKKEQPATRIFEPGYLPAVGNMPNLEVDICCSNCQSVTGMVLDVYRLYRAAATPTVELADFQIVNTPPPGRYSLNPFTLGGVANRLGRRL